MESKDLVQLIQDSSRWTANHQAEMAIGESFDANALSCAARLSSQAFRGMVRTISLENYAGETFPALGIGHLFPAVEKISFINCRNLRVVESISGFRGLKKLHIAFCPQLTSVYCAGRNSVVDLEVRASGNGLPVDVLCNNGRIKHCRIINVHYSARTMEAIEANSAQITDLQLQNSKPNLGLDELKRRFPNLVTVVDSEGERWTSATDFASRLAKKNAFKNRTGRSTWYLH